MLDIARDQVEGRQGDAGDIHHDQQPGQYRVTLSAVEQGSRRACSIRESSAGFAASGLHGTNTHTAYQLPPFDGQQQSRQQAAGGDIRRLLYGRTPEAAKLQRAKATAHAEGDPDSRCPV